MSMMRDSDPRRRRHDRGFRDVDDDDAYDATDPPTPPRPVPYDQEQSP